MDIQGKRTFVFEKITDYLKENDFKKRGNHFFKSNGEIGYCVNIQNDKWNDADQIRFTLNVGIFTEAFWLECEDFKNTGIIPTFPKEYECAIRKRIGGLLPVKEDKWYCITSCTYVMKLWNKIERDLTEYILPFFTRTIPNLMSYPINLSTGKEASDETDLSGEMDNCSIVCDYVLLFFRCSICGRDYQD